MILRIGIIFFLFATSALSGQNDIDPSSKNSVLIHHMNELLRWFPGEYDNHQQVYKEAVTKLSEEKRHRHTHHIFKAVDLDYLPGKTIYAQQSQHYDLDNIYRQRIYSFEIDEKENAIRLTIYTPKDALRLKNAHINPAIFEDLSPDDFFLKPGCEVYWKKRDNQFEGYLKKNSCNYYSERFGKRVYLNETLILRKDALLLDDRATDIDGNLVFGVDDKGPTINLKQKECK